MAIGASGGQIAAPRNSADSVPDAPDQKNGPDDKQPIGNISGTVTDQDGSIIPSAVIVLDGDSPADSHTVIANGNGFFEFKNLRPAAYRLTVTASGFTDWTSQVLHLSSGQFLMVDKIALKIAISSASVTVTASPAEVAVAQVRLAEKQRVLGFIPNFLVVYDHEPAPLTTRLKFTLAMKVAVDPVTFIGVAGLAGINQAASTPNYVEGAKGYGQRAGALYADGFTDLLLGGAILPSLLHQDPRYFYQGTGTRKSRALHALFSPFVCRGDNGRRQPNYSSLGGNLASTAISETYYPDSNRGPGLIIGDFLIGTGERMASSLAQEFLLRKLTPGAAKNTE
jgi:Carboxypeptidase regulatory-like domain